MSGVGGAASGGGVGDHGGLGGEAQSRDSGAFSDAIGSANHNGNEIHPYQGAAPADTHATPPGLAVSAFVTTHGGPPPHAGQPGGPHRLRVAGDVVAMGDDGLRGFSGMEVFSLLGLTLPNEPSVAEQTQTQQARLVQSARSDAPIVVVRGPGSASAAVVAAPLAGRPAPAPATGGAAIGSTGLSDPVPPTRQAEPNAAPTAPQTVAAGPITAGTPQVAGPATVPLLAPLTGPAADQRPWATAIAAAEVPVVAPQIVTTGVPQAADTPSTAVVRTPEAPGGMARTVPPVPTDPATAPAVRAEPGALPSPHDTLAPRDVQPPPGSGGPMAPLPPAGSLPVVDALSAAPVSFSGPPTGGQNAPGVPVLAAASVAGPVGTSMVAAPVLPTAVPTLSASPQEGARLVPNGPAAAPPAPPPATTATDVAPRTLSRAEAASFLFGAADPATGQPAPWTALGLSPQAWATALAERPWEVASAQLGVPGAIDAVTFARLEALPGPLAALLRAGADPRAALAVQDSWLALAGPGGAAQAWGLADAAPGLRALAPSLPPGVDAARLQETARHLLGTQAASPPAALPQDLVLALAGSAVLPLAPGQAPPPGWAAIAVPSAAGGAPVMLMAEVARLPETLPAFQVAPGLTIRRDPQSHAMIVVPDAGGALGALAPPVAAALAERLARLDLPGLPRGLDLQVALAPAADGSLVFTGLGGTVLAADGTIRSLGAPLRAEEPGRAAATATPAWVGPSAILHLRAGASAGSDARAMALGERFIEYIHPVPVPLDLAAGPGAAPLPPDTPRLWRVDDTRVFVALEGATTEAAMAEAADLHRKAVQGRLLPAELRPGTGVSTWDGSTLSLAWAGIRKPAGAGVGTADADAPRVELMRATESLGAGYLALRPADGRQVVAPRPDEGLRLFLAYGLDPTAAAGGPAPPGAAEFAATAREGFAGALLEMERVKLAWWLPPVETARRQEAWAAIARDWAATLTDLAASGTAPVVSAAKPLSAQVADLTRIIERHGGAAAWHAAVSGGIDLAAVLGAAGAAADALSAALAPSAMRAASAFGLPADTAQGGAAVEPVADLLESRIGFVATAAAVMLGQLPLAELALQLAQYGAAALEGAAAGAPLGRGDDAALAARLGRGAVTDVDRGYVSPFLRTARSTAAEAREEDEERPERRARVG